MIITAYRVSQEYMASIGPKTSAMQQFRNLSQEFCKKKKHATRAKTKVSIYSRPSGLATRENLPVL